MVRAIGIVAVLLTLVGCASYPGGVVETDSGSYFVRARTGSLILGEFYYLRPTAEVQAYQHCEAMNLEVNTLSGTTERTRALDTYYTTRTLVFECVEAVEWIDPNF